MVWVLQVVPVLCSRMRGSNPHQQENRSIKKKENKLNWVKVELECVNMCVILLQQREGGKRLRLTSLNREKEEKKRKNGSFLKKKQFFKSIQFTTYEIDETKCVCHMGRLFHQVSFCLMMVIQIFQ